jgi:integrase
VGRRVAALRSGDRTREPEPQPDARPVEMIRRVLDALWYRTAMSNRGWKTLSRALVLAHTGMRASQLKRLDVDIDIRPHLVGDDPFVQVSAGLRTDPVRYASSRE